MRVSFKLAFICVVALAASAGLATQGSAAATGLSPGGAGLAAHVSSSIPPVYHSGIHSARSDFCYAQHIHCRLDAGYGSRDRHCLRRRGCYPRYHGDDDHGDIFAYRRKGYSCRHWYHRCRDNWFYGEDVRGCMRYYGCPTYY